MPSINPLVSSIEWLDGVWMYVNAYESSIVYYTTNASDPPEEWVWDFSLIPDTDISCEMLTYNGSMCTASAISNSGFTISWSGGTNTNVYTYTLDNIPITPTIDNGLSQQTATFSGLTSSTLYTVSITYNTENEGSITSSVLVKTLSS